ncbi:hypothetical protein BDF19DRAFT_463398 [Syncephalis fuscata]|nr:hypothetical protein BDF19DRAFT_463398 [Syncephalis fuscata]
MRETKKTTTASNTVVRVRVAVPEDVIHVDRLHQLINQAYRGDKSWTTETHLVTGERITKQDLIEKLTTSKPPTLLAELVSTDANDTSTAPPLVVGTVEINTTDSLGEPATSSDDDNGEKDGGNIKQFSYGLVGLLAVDPEHQSRRIGSSLVRAAEEYTRDQLHLSHTGVWVIKQRTDIIKWYQRMGFIDSGRELPFVWDHLLLDKTARFRVFLKPLNQTDNK